MTRDHQLKRNLILAAVLIGAVVVVGILLSAPKVWWLAVLIAWIWSIALSLAAMLPPRKTSFRAAKLATLWLAVANLSAIAFLTYPYWEDWLEGQFLYATRVSMWMYGLLAAAWVLVAIAALVNMATPYGLSRLLMLVPGFVAITLVVKWILILAMGMEPFHNRMGMGMEILAYVPNLVIDALLILSATASTFTGFVLQIASSSSIEGRRC